MGEHGGHRPGAGRKKKDRGDQEFFEDAQSYLLAVVQGRTPPDAVRVQAAKTLIQYETAKKRAPVKSPSPSQLHEKTQADIEKTVADEFERKAEQLRSKYKGKQ
jgi:cytochrome c556